MLRSGCSKRAERPPPVEPMGRRRELEAKTRERIEEKWWRRRESNPRPKARPRRTLQPCLLLNVHARREEAAKNRRTLGPANLTATRRAATWPPACLMASDPQPPGEA